MLSHSVQQHAQEYVFDVPHLLCAAALLKSLTAAVFAAPHLLCAAALFKRLCSMRHSCFAAVLPLLPPG